MSSPSPSAAKPGPFRLDPVYLHARREAVFILALFAICVVWSVSVCWLDGYLGADEALPDDFATVLGMPRWVFWGIFLPWIFADAATVVFCFFFMKDDDLGESHEGEDLSQQVQQERRQAGEDRDV